MDRNFFSENREKVIGEMADDSCLIMFSGIPPVATADEYYFYQPHRNLYYLTGIARPDVILWIVKHSGSSEARLFLPNGKNSIAGLTDFPLTQKEAEEISGITIIDDSDSFNTLLSRHVERMPCNRVYFDFTRLHIDAARTPLELYAEDFRIRYPGLEIRDIHKSICQFRVIKSPDEIIEIRKAAEITKAGILAMMKNCRPFINERDLEAEFMYQLYKHGEPLPSFANIIASGKNALIGHYSANNKTIEDNVLVQLDVGDRYMPLAPGMVIAIDSAMGIPGEEINFRIEDDLLITETGNEVLTREIPRTIDEIERTISVKDY